MKGIILTPKIEKALNLASRLHSHQTRKGDGLPYIVHPVSVAWMLAGHTYDEDVICAALLHDVLEDVKGYRFNDLKRDFGEKVARIVKEVSEDKDPDIEIDEKATWEERKRKYLENLKNDSKEALLICAADKIHNLESMTAAYKERGEEMWKDFNSPPDKKLWFYEEVLRILEARLADHPLVTILHNALWSAERAILKKSLREIKLIPWF